jgi:hypothetical protein
VMGQNPPAWFFPHSSACVTFVATATPRILIMVIDENKSHLIPPEKINFC